MVPYLYCLLFGGTVPYLQTLRSFKMSRYTPVSEKMRTSGPSTGNIQTKMCGLFLWTSG